MSVPAVPVQTKASPSATPEVVKDAVIGLQTEMCLNKAVNTWDSHHIKMLLSWKVFPGTMSDFRGIFEPQFVTCASPSWTMSKDKNSHPVYTRIPQGSNGILTVIKVEAEMREETGMNVWKMSEIQCLPSYPEFQGTVKDFFGQFSDLFVTCASPSWTVSKKGKNNTVYTRIPQGSNGILTVLKVEAELREETGKNLWGTYEIQCLPSYAEFQGTHKDFFGQFSDLFVTCASPSWTVSKQGSNTFYTRIPQGSNGILTVNKVEAEMREETRMNVWKTSEIQRLPSYPEFQGTVKDFFGQFSDLFVTCASPSWRVSKQGSKTFYTRIPQGAKPDSDGVSGGGGKSSQRGKRNRGVEEESE